TDFGKIPKKLAGALAPDLGEVFNVSVSNINVCHISTALPVWRRSCRYLQDESKRKVEVEVDVAADKLTRKPKVQRGKGQGFLPVTPKIAIDVALYGQLYPAHIRATYCFVWSLPLIFVQLFNHLLQGANEIDWRLRDGVVVSGVGGPVKAREAPNGKLLATI
ncbi:hypothetical protein K503DRAFT_863572, partial [Rhizopogon vinicolor AM-OR11-026]